MVKSGVLTSQGIRKAIDQKIISSQTGFTDGQVQPNSIDLRIGTVGHRVRCSFLPGEEGIHRKIERFKVEEHQLLASGVVLSQNQPYIFQLREKLSLPSNWYGRANPKSTTGRLDVFTRLVTENGTAFDEVPFGYSGALFLEIVPRSFAIRVRPGDSLAQLRLHRGEPCLSDEETRELVDHQDIIFTPDHKPLRSGDLDISSGITLSVDLPSKGGVRVGYQARKNSPSIDLQAKGLSKIDDYWNTITNKQPVILHPDDFYLFRSHELISLPPQYCAEMVAFDASSGEVRTHYAGFFDSGFGYESKVPPERTASAVVLEVRSRDVPFLIEDRQPLFRVNILRCWSSPDMLYSKKSGSHYQSQGLRLPKQFKAIDEEPGQLAPSTQVIGKDDLFFDEN